MAATVHVGGFLPAAVWVTGRSVTGVADGATLPLARGANLLLLRYDSAGRGHFVLSAPDRAGVGSSPGARTPLSMSWYDLPGRLEYDLRPGVRRPTGWYRFTAPPGLRALSFVVTGEPQVWVDGSARTVVSRRSYGRRPNEAREYRVELEVPIRPQSVVAIRVEHNAGRYAGAAFAEPVQLECGPGVTLLGDWATDSALECYSGGARYRTRFTLRGSSAGRQLWLDLGAAVATAEVLVNGRPAGTRVAPPWTFVLHDEICPGENVVEVIVYNTLANHYRTIPTRYRGPSLVSGLLGPVTISDVTHGLVRA